VHLLAKQNVLKYFLKLLKKKDKDVITFIYSSGSNQSVFSWLVVD